jgi:hypothetical protein
VGTVNRFCRSPFEDPKPTLKTWFVGTCFLRQPNNRTSALESRRELGTFYNAAWSL